MLRSFQIDVLNEIKLQILDIPGVEIRDVINIINNKIVKIDKAMDAELEDMKRLDDQRE